MTPTPASGIAGELLPPGPPLPRALWIRPAQARGEVRAPPSKSYTHRAFVMGALSAVPLTVHGPLIAEDTLASLRAIGALGGGVVRQDGPPPADTGRLHLQVVPPALWPEVRRLPGEANVGESGTTLRLFSAAAAMGSRDVKFVGHPALARRPMEGLLQALTSLGATCAGPPPGTSLPFSIHGPLRAGKISVPGSVSSQFISALLLVLPLLRGGSEVVVQGTRVSEPYIEATLAMLRGQGVGVDRREGGFVVPGDQRYRGADLHVPGDASSAAYVLAMGALTGGPVRVTDLPSHWPQADLALLDVLVRCGASVRRREAHIEVTGGPRPLSAFEVDLDPSPDLAPLLGVLAAFASGRSTLHGGAHLAAKESDRRAGTLRLARALGAKATDEGGRMTIVGPATARNLELLDLQDHRMLFSAAVAASALPETSHLGDGRCAAKSHPGFFADLRSLGVGATEDGAGEAWT